MSAVSAPPSSAEVSSAGSTEPAAALPQGDLLSLSFVGLLVTQFLTAVNDNIFRWLVIGISKQYVNPEYHGQVLMFGTACFVLPYMLLAAPAGYLADRFSKRGVIIGCKVAEIVILLLGVTAIITGQQWLLFTVVALTGAQSALFSPSKMGSIPEMLRADKISAANGLFGLATVIAIVVGMAVGNVLTDVTGARGQERWWLSALVLLGVAVVGWLASLVIARLPAADPSRRFPWNPARDTVRDIRILASNRALLRVALGMVFFWAVGGLAQLNIDQYAFEGGATQQSDVIPLLLSLTIGVGVGSVLAGVWSQGKVELGILPLGSGGVAVSSILLFSVFGTLFDDSAAWTAAYAWACLLLFLLGTSAGLFQVPLEAYMQHRSPVQTRGSILAAANFLVFAGVLGASLVFWGLRTGVYEGSLAAVPVIAQTELTPAAEARVAAVESRFPEQPGESTIEELLDDAAFRGAAGAGEREVLLARLLWEEFRRGREAGKYIDRNTYLERFPEDRRLVFNVYEQAMGPPLFTSRQIFLLTGLLTLPVFVYIVRMIPQASARFVVWLASLLFYRIRVFGRENLPQQGGALLICNHASWLDGILVVMCSSRPVRLIGYAGNFQNNPVLNWLAWFWEVIPISNKPKMIRAAFETAREALRNGELVCIFPEGGITRTGQVQGFRPGLMKILEGTDAPIVPIYLDELWGSIFSFDRGRFFWKLPRRWPYPVSIHFGKPLAQPVDLHQARQALQDLGARAVKTRADRIMTLPITFLRQCKRRRSKPKVADSSGADLAGGMFLLRTLVLRRLLRRHVLAPEERFVGLLLPPSAPGVAANMALAIDHRVPVNLNYTVSSAVINECIAQAGIKHVLTSKRFMSKMNLQVEAELIYLEDLAAKPTKADKLIAALGAYLLPAGMLGRLLGLHKIKATDLATIIFTSGSTGTPKGVMLTYGNIGHNVEAIDQVIRLTPADVLIGVVPLFHSFGYTIAMWGVMGLDIKGVYHYSPLDARQIGKLTKEHQGTVLLATPTFLRTYLRRIEPEEFATLDVVVAGAEKLPKELSDAFEARFSIRPVEGYGATELSPLVSVNIPPSRSNDNFQPDSKEGSVGRTVPGVSAKVTDLDTGAELGAGRPGMLWITGPNVMQGYLGRDDLTAEVLKEGWYMTGDVALIDEQGFIHITGRESRFSKIGGEMVPHIRIEEELNRAIGSTEEEGLKAVVTAVPDSKKGERLVVLHTRIDQSPAELCAALAAAGLPNLYIPSEDSFLQVDALPMLGTGKLDLKGLRQVALDRFAPEA